MEVAASHLDSLQKIIGLDEYTGGVQQQHKDYLNSNLRKNDQELQEVLEELQALKIDLIEEEETEN